jgi:hypothetical protein
MFQTQNVEKIKSLIFMSSNFPPPLPENRAVYEIMWKNVVRGGGSPQMIIWRMRIACWIPKAARAHTLRIYIFDMIYLTAIGLPPGGSSTVQTIHRTTRNEQYIEQHKN